MYMYSTQSTAVEATASIDQGVMNQIKDLVNEINNFWVDVTGSGLPTEEIETLESMHPDDLLSKLQGLKMEESKEYAPYYTHVVNGVEL